MSPETFKNLGQVAGAAGVAIGALIVVFREILRKSILPKLTREQAYRLLWGLAALIWSVAVVALFLPGGRVGGDTGVQTGDVTKSVVSGGDIKGSTIIIQGGESGQEDMPR